MKHISCYSKILPHTVGILMLLIVLMGCVSESVNKDANAISSEARNKATMHRFIEEVYHKGNMDVFDEVFAENCVIHINEKTASLEIAKRQTRMINGMYREIKVTIDDIIAEGDLVAMRVTFKGIFRRNGNEMTLPSITFCRFKDEKVIEIWRAFDNAYIFKQLGINPPPTN